MCFVWLSEQTAIISLYSFNWLVFTTERECVYCAIQTETLNTIQGNYSPCKQSKCILETHILYHVAGTPDTAGSVSAFLLQQRRCPPANAAVRASRGATATIHTDFESAVPT